MFYRITPSQNENTIEKKGKVERKKENPQEMAL